MLENRYFAPYRDETERIIRELCDSSLSIIRYHDRGKELAENMPSATEVYMLAFLQGNFQYVAEQAMNTKKALGWSSTFMKCGIAAFLLLLFEGEQLGAGCSAMPHLLRNDIRFDVKKYEAGMAHGVDAADDYDWLWNCLFRWKQGVALTAEKRVKYIFWLEQLIERRTEGILGAKRRNY